jgi:transposase
MAHSADTRDTVRRLYIEGMPLTSAATSEHVSYETARDWKAKAKARGDDWDTARSAYRVSEQGIDSLSKSLTEDFARNAIATTRQLDTEPLDAAEKTQLLAQIADAYAKFSRAFSRINPSYTYLSIALDTLKTIVEHLSRKDKAALTALQPHLDEIGAALSKRYA